MTWDQFIAYTHGHVMTPTEWLLTILIFVNFFGIVIGAFRK